ncbi:MAG: HAD-IIB family hydrolase [Gammaproteobacteria bacterium]|nr:HAD-IIB family hydrolase [Gammaproteobacteria bacterium]
MRYLALVTDYDGTLAAQERISPETVHALERLRVSGRRIILLTGRRLDDLLDACPHASLFDMIVAENGGVLFNPGNCEVTLLGPPPPRPLVERLRKHAVEPLEIGQVLVATRVPHRQLVQDLVWELGLEAQVIGNRGAVMVLPAGVNKASGLQHALRRLGLSRHEVVCIGDAENDHSFMNTCECATAVANAVPSLKSVAAIVTTAANGNGVIELIDELIADDLHRTEGALPQHWIRLGAGADGATFEFPPYGHNMLIAGPSGSGKSTLAAGIIERLIEKDYQVCIIDPEGDYGAMRDVVAIGNRVRAPSVIEALAILEDPKINLSINMLGIPPDERPEFFSQLIPNLQAMRARTGRPHWLVLDEAHHLLPHSWGHATSVLPQRLHETLLITVHPDHVAPAILKPIDLILAVGHGPEATIARFAGVTGRELSWPDGLSYQPNHVVAWSPRECLPPSCIRPQPSRAERIRHQRKYAEGDLRWRSFYFRGPEQRHNLKAQNLAIFCQIAEGIDDDVWMFHLRRGDYSNWFRHAIKDDHLARETARIECRNDLAAAETRKLICELIRARYTLPE